MPPDFDYLDLKVVGIFVNKGYDYYFVEGYDCFLNNLEEVWQFACDVLPEDEIEKVRDLSRTELQGYEIGDFTEFFGDDALVISKLLKKPLTKSTVDFRHFPKGSYLCGIVWHEIENAKQLAKHEDYKIVIKK